MQIFEILDTDFYNFDVATLPLNLFNLTNRSDQVHKKDKNMESRSKKLKMSHDSSLATATINDLEPNRQFQGLKIFLDEPRLVRRLLYYSSRGYPIYNFI